MRKSIYHHTQATLTITVWVGLLILGLSLPGCNSPTQDTATQASPRSRETARIASLPPPDRAMEADSENSSLAAVVYYFHRTIRCHGCLQIELMADQAIRKSFPQELENGKLLWLVLNMDEPENQPYVKEYELNASDLVLVDARKDKNRPWKKLENVWKLHSDHESFNQYLRTEIAKYLADEKK